jgi:hypothetical protein
MDDEIRLEHPEFEELSATMRREASSLLGSLLLAASNEPPPFNGAMGGAMRGGLPGAHRRPERARRAHRDAKRRPRRGATKVGNS